MNSRRTVLQLIDLFGPGGAEKIYVTVASRLDRGLYRVVGAVPGPGWTASELERAGLDVRVTPLSGGGFDWRYLSRLLRVIREERVDIVHAHLLGPAVYAAIAGGMLGIPVIATFHGSVDIATDERLLGTKMWLLRRYCDAIACVSEALRNAVMIRTGMDAARLTVVENGIDPTPVDPEARTRIRNQLGVGEDEIVVGAVGHLRPAKDYPCLIDAAELLLRRDSRYRFVVVGQVEDNDYHLSLRQQVARLGIGHAVVFAGLRTDVDAVLRAFDIYAISSSSEGFSLSTVQAMRAGLPVVATKCGGPETILDHGKTGLLVPVGEPPALADAISQLVSNRDLAARLGRTAASYALGRYTEQAMVDRYAALYESAWRR